MASDYRSKSAPCLANVTYHFQHVICASTLHSKGTMRAQDATEGTLSLVSPPADSPLDGYEDGVCHPNTWNH